MFVQTKRPSTHTIAASRGLQLIYLDAREVTATYTARGQLEKKSSAN